MCPNQDGGVGSFSEQDLSVAPEGAMILMSGILNLDESSVCCELTP